MWSQPHSHAVYPAPPPAWMSVAPAPGSSAGHHASTGGPPSAGRRDQRPQAVAIDFNIPVSVSGLQALAGSVAQKLRETPATDTAAQPASAVISVAPTEVDVDFADFRSQAARVALAGVSCAVLLLLLVSTVTRRWQLRRLAVHERARARRRERRRTRDTVESAGTSRTHDLVSKQSETEQEEQVRGRTVPRGGATNEKGTSTDTAIPLPGTSIATAATTDPLHTPARGGEEKGTGDRREKGTVPESDIRSNRQISLVATNSEKSGRETYKRLRRRYAGEGKILPTSSVTAPHKVVLPVVKRPVHDRVRRLHTSPRSSDDYELTASEGEALDIGDETHSIETPTGFYHMYLPHESYYRTHLVGVDKTRRRRAIRNKRRRGSALTNPQSLRQMMSRRRFQQELLSAATEELSGAAIDAETETADMEGTEPAVASSERRRRTKRREERKGNKCKYRNRRRRHRRRDHFCGHGRSAARERTLWSDGEHEGERGFVGGVLHRLLMMTALPAFT